LSKKRCYKPDPRKAKPQIQSRADAGLKPRIRNKVVQIDPIRFGDFLAYEVRCERRHIAAMKMVGLKRNSVHAHKIDFSTSMYQLLRYHAVLALNLVQHGEEWGQRWLDRPCVPWWLIARGGDRYCHRYQTCPFCHSRRLVHGLVRLAATADQLNAPRPRLHHDLVAIRHTAFLHASLSDEEMQAAIAWEVKQRSYFMRDLPHYGAVWSTTLQPPVYGGKSWGPRHSSYELRTAALLMVPERQVLPQRRKWSYVEWQRCSPSPMHFYQYGERLFKYPRRLLEDSWPQAAVRAARLMRGHRLHAEIKSKLPLLQTTKPEGLWPNIA